MFWLYSVVDSGGIRNLVHKAWRNFDVDSGPLYVNTFVGIRKLDIQWSTNIDAIPVEVVRAISILLISFVYHSIIIIVKWSSQLVYGSGPSMAMATYCSVREGRNKRSFRCSLLAREIIAHENKSLTAA